MGRNRLSTENYLEDIIKYTTIDKHRNNLLIRTVDLKKEYINYIIDIDLFKSYVEKILIYCKDKENIDIQEIENLLKDDIYQIYKTKVSTKRIPILIFNIFVLLKYFDCDNGILYIKKRELNYKDIIDKVVL